MLVASSANSAVTENFDYEDGPLVDKNGGAGWGGAWENSFSRRGGDFVIQGSAAKSPFDGSRHSRRLDQTYSSGIIYLDLVLQLNGTGDNPFAAVELFSSSGVVDDTRSIVVGVVRNEDMTTETEFFVTSENGTDGAQVANAQIAPFDTERNRFIVRIDLDDSTAHVFFNPAPGADVTTTTGDVTVPLAETVGFDTLSIANFGNQVVENSVTFDNIYLGSDAPVIVDEVDTDEDGIPDWYELANGLNVNVDDADDDNDAGEGPDGLTNLQEFQLGTDPQNPDSDEDGLLDGAEVNGTDNPYASDEPGTPATGAPGLATDPLSEDSDQDGILDGVELTTGEGNSFITNPNIWDTDDDGLSDLFETTDKGFGTLDPTDSDGENGDAGDPDDDDLLNIDELDLGTDLRNPDSDEDGLDDGVEDETGEFIDRNATGTDPLNPDTDEDGLLDGQEALEFGAADGVTGIDPADAPLYNSDPNIPDTDSDGFSDFVEVTTGGSDPNDDSSIPNIDSDDQAIDNFDYTDGPLADQDGGSGWEGAWTAGFSRREGEFNIISGVAGSPNDGARITRKLDRPYANGIVYVDMLFQLTDTTDNPFAALELFTGDNVDDTRVVSIGVLRNEDGVPETNFFIDAENGTDGTSFSGAEIAPFDANWNRFIARLDLDDDTADVFFNPTSETDLVNGEGQAFTFLAETAGFDSVGLANFGDQANPNAASFDNLYIGRAVPTVEFMPPSGDGVVITSTRFTDANTLVIDFRGEPDTEYNLVSSVDLVFPADSTVSQTTNGVGGGQFIVTVDLTTDPKNFFRIATPAAN